MDANMELHRVQRPKWNQTAITVYGLEMRAFKLHRVLGKWK